VRVEQDASAGTISAGMQKLRMTRWRISRRSRNWRPFHWCWWCTPRCRWRTSRRPARTDLVERCPLL